jgi:hypothetical protein
VYNEKEEDQNEGDWIGLFLCFGNYHFVMLLRPSPYFPDSAFNPVQHLQLQRSLLRVDLSFVEILSVSLS